MKNNDKKLLYDYFEKNKEYVLSIFDQDIYEYFIKNAKKKKDKKEDKKDKKEDKKEENAKDLIENYWYALSLCHSCTIHVNDEGEE